MTLEVSFLFFSQRTCTEPRTHSVASQKRLATLSQKSVRQARIFFHTRTDFPIGLWDIDHEPRTQHPHPPSSMTTTGPHYNLFNGWSLTHPLPSSKRHVILTTTRTHNTRTVTDALQCLSSIDHRPHCNPFGRRRTRPLPSSKGHATLPICPLR